ncbi:Tyrosine-protein kinase ptk [Sphingobacterium multivorum]|uniref:Tyrosine-protein kinase ptk n=1 Tax=Sphingobacterium multivorum TaxID=28454 RepID=A0A2X2J967_SPHMU|nr:Wzz/FepE/Etk N-terminal domain-containing protein [Sphingobacterium multivorum]SPZ88456.1 Tyrosine-protein kinase ptk [Sphingobacterium multivorum]
MSKKNIDWEEEFDFETEKSDNKDLLRFFGRLMANWYWFALCGFLGLLSAFFYLRYSIPNYKVHAKLLVSDDKKGGGMFSSSALGDLSSLMGTKNSVDNEVEVLKTADLMREMVLSEKAYLRYFKAGRVHNVPVGNAPYTLELLSEVDSVSEPYSFKIHPLNANELELSNSDTSFRVRMGQTFSLAPQCKLKAVANPAFDQSREDDYGFVLSPVRDVVDDLAKPFW